MWPTVYSDKIRRRLIRIGCLIMQKPKIFVYRAISTVHLIGDPTVTQPLLAVGLGKVEFSGLAILSTITSPFFSLYSNMEARHASATISSGNGKWSNNR